MVWPKSLVTELGARRCIIFLGAGASAGSISQDGATRPATWSALLQKLIALMNDRSLVPLVQEYINKEKFLDAAEIIIQKIWPADFSSFIREEFEIPRYKPSETHKAILEIDPKIVLTTNYDTIYDQYCKSGAAVDGYVVSKYYDDNIVSDLRSPVRLIIKAHGCTSDIDKIILTRSQYFKVRQKYPNFYKVLDGLFLTHTILFIGYSLTDPDIQLVLENVNISAPSRHSHYLVIGNNFNDAVKNSYKEAYNVGFIEYEAGNFNELIDGLADLSFQVNKHRINNPGSV